MKETDLDRLERAALAQVGKDIGTPITVTPRELLELCKLARQAIEKPA